MPLLIAFPILTILTILQSAIASQIKLIYGNADIVLVALIAWSLQEQVDNAWQWAVIAGLLVNIPSALPLGIPLAGYLIATGMSLLLKRFLWQVPFLAMLLAIILSTIVSLGLAWGSLVALGRPLPLNESFNLVILPSLLLNLICAIPFYTLADSLAELLYPEEEVTV